MERFSLDKWLQDKSRKVITRDGREVELYYSPTSRIPLIGVTTSDNEIHQYTKDGFQCDTFNQAKNDLFFADEEEGLTEFEKEVDAIIDENIKHNIGVRYEAVNLLGLARKQIEETNVIIEKEKYLTICDQYYNNGKKEALKDIPRWRYKKDSIPLLHDSFILNKYNCIGKSPSGAQVSDVWVLEIDKLVNLPKEGE